MLKVLGDNSSRSLAFLCILLRSFVAFVLGGYLYIKQPWKIRVSTARAESRAVS